MKAKPQQQQLGGGDRYAKECVTVEPLMIKEEYIRLPPDLYHWNGRYADAVDEETQAEAARKDVVATILLELRYAKENDLDVQGPGDTTHRS